MGVRWEDGCIPVMRYESMEERYCIAFCFALLDDYIMTHEIASYHSVIDSTALDSWAFMLHSDASYSDFGFSLV